MDRDSNPPVNLDYVREMTGNDTAFLKEFLETFLSDISKRLPDLEKAMVHFDGRRVRDLAHSFVGSATCLGAEELHRVTVELENTALSGHLKPTQEAFELFRNELREVQGFLALQLEQGP